MTALDTSTYTATENLYGRAMFGTGSVVPDPFSPGTVNSMTDAVELANGRHIGRSFSAACNTIISGFGSMSGYAFISAGEVRLPFSRAAFIACNDPLLTPYSTIDFCAEYPPLSWLRPCTFFIVPDFTTMTTLHVYYRAADGSLYSGTLTATGTRPTYETSGGSTQNYIEASASWNSVYNVGAAGIPDYAPANPEFIRYWYWRGTDGNPYWYKLPAGIIS